MQLIVEYIHTTLLQSQHNQQLIQLIMQVYPKSVPPSKPKENLLRAAGDVFLQADALPDTKQ